MCAGSNQDRKVHQVRSGMTGVELILNCDYYGCLAIARLID